MYTSAYKANRVVTSALSVTYEIERHYETVSGSTVYWWKVTRRATKDYKFVDMTENAVVKAAANKVAKYTRSTKKCISRTLDKTCNSLTSTVQPKRNSCGSWDLEINVQEEDSTHSATLPADPASLFTTENARDYDEGEGGIEITGCTHDGSLHIVGTLTGALVGAPATDIKLYYNGTVQTAGVTVVKTATNAFTITATNWDSTHSSGTVKCQGVSAEWQFTVASVTLSSDTYAEAWEPPTSMLHIDMTATVAGSISTSDVKFYLAFGSAELEDWTDVLTITTTGTTARATKDYQFPSTSGTLRMQAVVGTLSSSIVTYTWSV